jgi:hypothetical protein
MTISPWIGFTKGKSTVTQVSRALLIFSHYSVIWVLPCLCVMISSVGVTWGIILQRPRPDSVLWPLRTIPFYLNLEPILCFPSNSLLRPL